MKDHFVGDITRSFKLSKEFDDMIRVVATHEGRTVSATIRRALALYFTEGDYFSPEMAADMARNHTLTRKALAEE